jgi:tetratricopeptide (TPR) repeat protein
MAASSHKTIWWITAGFVALAIIAIFTRSTSPDSPFNSPVPDIAIEQRDRHIDKLHSLIQTDWRMRRTPTRAAVEQVAAYAQHPSLATAEAWYALALFRFYGDSDLLGATAALDEAIRLRPEWSWPYSLRGTIQFTQGDTITSLKSFHHAMELDPEWSRPYSDLAILYRLDKNWQLAREYAQTAMEMDPDNPIPYYNYAVILDFQGLHDQATEYYKRTLDMNADLPAPYYNMACGFARRAEVEESLQYLEIAVRLDPAFHTEAQSDPDFDSIRTTQQFIDFMNIHQP